MEQKNYSKGRERKHQYVKTKFQQANLSDDILFGMVMLNDEFAKIVLSIVLERNVVKVQKKSIQKSLLNLPGYKSIRLDVIIELEDSTICEVEMQTVKNDNMPKRARFYQGLMDAVTLYAGEEVKYGQLPETIVIFITEFDVFGKGRYKYTFKNKCLEEMDLELGDGCTKIFLNTMGEVKGKEPQELIDFLKFIHDSSEENANGNDKLEKLYQIVKEFKSSSEKEREYMRVEALREDYERIGLERGRAEGRTEGRTEGREILTKLLNHLIKVGRNKDIDRALNDMDYQEQLLKEFDL